MKNDFQFDNDLSHNDPFGGNSTLRRVLAARDNEICLDESFRWHRIRRMSRK